jgi:hypothetical protein
MIKLAPTILTPFAEILYFSSKAGEKAFEESA